MTSFRVLHILSFVCLLALCSTASANSVGSVYRDALALYQTTGTGDLSLEDAGAQRRQAAALLSPSLGLVLEGGYLRNELRSGNGLPDTNVTVRQTKTALSLVQPLLDRELKFAVAAAETSEAAAELQYRRDKQILAEDAASKYLELQLQHELFQLSKNKYRRLSTELVRVQKLVSQGFSAEMDLAEVMLEIERAKLEILESHKQVNIAKAALFQLTGKAYAPVSGGRQFSRIEASVFQVGSMENLKDTAFRDNLDLQVIKLQITAARERARSASAATGPKITLQGEVSRTQSREDLDQDVNDASVGIRLDQDLSFWGSSKHYSAQSAKVQARQQQRLENQVRFSVESDLRSLYAQYDGGVRSFFTLRQLLGRSQKKIDYVRRAIDLGKRDQRDLYGAILENFSIHESMLRQFYSLLGLQVQLRAYTGELDERTLSGVDRILQQAG